MPFDIPDPLNIIVLRKQEPESSVGRIDAVAPGRVRVSWIPEDEVTPEHEALIHEAHVALVGSGCPPDLMARMPSLVWVHANFAGISELADRDYWGTNVIMTSARGHTDLDALAEMALVGGLAVAKDLHTTARNDFDRWSGRRFVQPLLVKGKTLGIVGLGGIGTTLATIAKGMRMRVLATKRTATARQTDVDGVDVLYPASELLEMASECNFIAICAASTPETFHMIDTAVFDALPDGAVLMNIARGEIVDEAAMLDALDSGKLRGVYTDTYEGERDQLASRRLAEHPRVLRTPHVGSSSDVRATNRLDVFLDNLRHYLANEPMDNVVDWDRGY